MSSPDRREFLKGVLGTLVQATGTVVVASSAFASTPKNSTPKNSPPKDSTAKDSTAKDSTGAEWGGEGETPKESLRERADRIADACKAPEGEAPEDDTFPVNFLNGTFRNTPLTTFRNSPLGGFSNGPLRSFNNGPLGGFRNGPLRSSFSNGAWPNGLTQFLNGGWPNIGWRNGW